MRKFIGNLKFNRGFTLIELMVAIGMLSILAAGLITMLDPIGKIKKANDARRMSDLSQLQKSLEIYYQDNESYPPNIDYKVSYEGVAVDWGTRWGSEKQPYMASLPKDPSPNGKYIYVTNPGEQSYVIYAWLENIGNKDPVCESDDKKKCKSDLLTGQSCHTTNGCNYGISSPNISP